MKATQRRPVARRSASQRPSQPIKAESKRTDKGLPRSVSFPALGGREVQERSVRSPFLPPPPTGKREVAGVSDDDFYSSTQEEEEEEEEEKPPKRSKAVHSARQGAVARKATPAGGLHGKGRRGAPEECAWGRLEVGGAGGVMPLVWHSNTDAAVLLIMGAYMGAGHHGDVCGCKAGITLPAALYRPYFPNPPPTHPHPTYLTPMQALPSPWTTLRMIQKRITRRSRPRPPPSARAAAWAAGAPPQRAQRLPPQRRPPLPPPPAARGQRAQRAGRRPRSARAQRSAGAAAAPLALGRRPPRLWWSGRRRSMQ
jgi:hypothetical protein